MEIKKLYIVELINGERHIFAKETDVNAYLNSLKDYYHKTANVHEWEIG